MPDLGSSWVGRRTAFLALDTSTSKPWGSPGSSLRASAFSRMLASPQASVRLRTLIGWSRQLESITWCKISGHPHALHYLPDSAVRDVWETQGIWLIYIYTYTYTYIYIHAVELKIRPRFGGFWVENPSKVALKIRPRFFLLAFPIFIVFFAGLKKTQIVCRGAKNFLAVCQGVKKGFSKKNVHFLFLSFLCWNK